MPPREGPDFYQNKKGVEFQSRNEKGQFSRIWIEESEFDRHSPEKYAELLSEGPCKVIFRRVSSKAGGTRDLKCIKPGPIPKNAFDPRYPTLISVIDLDEGKWKSFYYSHVFAIKRILPKELNYEQRKIALRFTGGDFDKLFPGNEEQHLGEEDLQETFDFGLDGKYPAILSNKFKKKEIENELRKQKFAETIIMQQEQKNVREQQRQQIIEKLQATDNNSTLQPDRE